VLFRSPGTTEYIKVLRECGFFSHEPIIVKGQKIRPIDLTALLLFPGWKLKPGEGDMTIMRILIGGIEDGEEITYTYDLYDEYDPVSGTISMARTTGYTCTAVATLIMEGKFSKTGICPPELICVTEETLGFVIEYLKERNVQYSVTRKEGKSSRKP
jgi:saccharopine dehydrogenase-like NADP-dependent oxidoreductase